jgi:hypothetical protein
MNGVLNEEVESLRNLLINQTLNNKWMNENDLQNNIRHEKVTEEDIKRCASNYKRHTDINVLIHLNNRTM